MRGILRDLTPGTLLMVIIMELSYDWVVGFVDGEGFFYVDFTEQPDITVGYQVLPEFRVVQHRRDINVLYGLKRFFKHGVVRQNHNDLWEFSIQKIDGLQEVVKIFRKHPLKTKKAVDFQKFARIVHWMGKNKHLTLEGLLEIVRMAQTMDTQSSSHLKEIEIDVLNKLEG